VVRIELLQFCCSGTTASTPSIAPCWRILPIWSGSALKRSFRQNFTAQGSLCRRSVVATRTIIATGATIFTDAVPMKTYCAKKSEWATARAESFRQAAREVDAQHVDMGR
jgi:hypothetical protein